MRGTLRRARHAAIGAASPGRVTPALGHRTPRSVVSVTREFKGRQITVKVTADGFTYAGKTYQSLTALAIHITGYKAVSGPRFFGLVEAKAKGGAK